MANIHVASVNGGKVVAGDSRYGFFGEVPVTELWSGDELSKLLGVTEGTLQHSNEPWLKFVLDGKIIYKSKKPFRHSISWDQLHAKDLVKGDKIIKDKYGNQYIVRLMRGALTDPSQNNNLDKGAKYSEWNKLMLPIHEQAKNKTWAYPQYVEPEIPSDWGIEYTDEDLVTNSSGGYGNYQHCLENTISNHANNVLRGNHAITSIGDYSSSFAGSTIRGWSPVLELISPSKTRYILKKDNDYGYYKTGAWHSLGNSLPECNVIKEQGMSSLGTLNPGDYEFTHLMTANAPTKQYNGVIDFNDEGLKNIKRIDVREVEIDG